MPNQLAASWALAASTSLGAVLLLLAGSDLPPPTGFIWVAAGAVVVGVLVRAFVPPLLRLRYSTGVLRSLLVSIAIGAAVGMACAALLVLRGSGEPTVDSAATGTATVFIAVTAVVGACAAAGVAATAMISAAMPRPPLAVLVAAAPGTVVSLIAIGVVGTRLAT